MRRPFTFLVALLLAAVATAQAIRAALGLEVVIDGHLIPVFASWIAFAVLLFLSLMVFAELRKS